MICQICEEKFMSLEWYKEKVEIPTCDICLLEILKARKEIKLSEIERIDRHIKELRNKIYRSKKEG